MAMIALMDEYAKKPFVIALRSFSHKNRLDTGSFHDQQARYRIRDPMRRGKSTPSRHTSHAARKEN